MAKKKFKIKKLEKKLPRSPLAVVAQHRNSAIFKHRAEERGGDRNDQRDLLDVAEEDAHLQDDEECEEDF